MIRRSDWTRLKRLVKSYGIGLVVIPSSCFTEHYSDLAWSVYDPSRCTIVVDQECASDENRLLFAVAHELGHAVDHVSEPDKARHYGLHFHISKAYEMFGIKEPKETKDVFSEREQMADEIGLSFLKELSISIPDHLFRHHPHDGSA